MSDTPEASHVPLRSANAHVAMVSPASRPGNISACKASLPSRASAAQTTLTGRNGPGAAIRPISSATMTASCTGCPDRLPPPCSSGTNNVVHPSPAALLHQSRSSPSVVSQSARTLLSGASLSRKRRVVSRKTLDPR